MYFIIILLVCLLSLLFTPLLFTYFIHKHVGYVGGSWYGHSGAAVDYLCMPKNPDWSGLKYKNGTSGSGGYVYGAEYETLYSNIGIDKSYSQYDVPCAVCRDVGHSSVVMVPSKTKCNASWTKQYSGYLMAGYYNHAAASQYICVDKDAEKVGTTTNSNGVLLYPVEARCGSLPCGPYVEGAELGCVVCTK
ncbi:hypothetical protein FSP39_011708 [Pinctada imbricata]|uniref:Short-chain collagen C4-like n=1 Tax=Pinctada imbricata TaxID=66713 RepID=A0AA88YI95_PINIB|nr:hypothetical protein FSP39_011708 [Pinctada imbricata]